MDEKQERKCCCDIHAGHGQVCPQCPHHQTKDPHIKPKFTAHRVLDVNTGGKL